MPDALRLIQSAPGRFTLLPLSLCGPGDADLTDASDEDLDRAIRDAREEPDFYSPDDEIQDDDRRKGIACEPIPVGEAREITMAEYLAVVEGAR